MSKRQHDSTYRGFVITYAGKILVQYPSKRAHNGFYLASDNQRWDGGLGIHEWEPIARDDPRIEAGGHEALEWLTL